MMGLSLLKKMTRKIQTSGTYDDEFYTLNIAFNDYHVVTLDGLSKEDMLELQSCVDCMLMEDEDGVGFTS
jgi:hypothetical protein